MDPMAVLFGTALVISLFTGKAYFRGVHVRSDNALNYWTIVIGYAVLACSTPLVEFLYRLNHP